MSNWLSGEAEAVLQAAEDEARRRRQALGTPHLLLGLVADPDSRPADALRAMGYSVAQVQYEAARKLGRVPAKPSRRRPVRSERVEVTLARALAEAERHGRAQVDPEDILLALVTDPEGKAASILRRLQPAEVLTDDDDGTDEEWAV